MKKILLFLSLICFSFMNLYSDEDPKISFIDSHYQEKNREDKPMYQAVFAYPILPGKTELERQRHRDRKEKLLDEEYQKDLQAYRQNMGWTEVKLWIQQLPKEDLHILLLKSDKPIDPEQICSRFRDLCESGSAVANDVHSFYLETEGVDFCSDYVSFESLPEIKVDFSEEELTDKTITEYAWAFPILPGQANRIIEYNQGNIDDPDRLAYFKAKRKQLGIIEFRAWIQRGFGREMLVLQSKEIDPPSKLCDAWLDSVKSETIMKKHAELYFQTTGLTPEEMLPNLERL
ncbi:MAG: hypothetical protein KAR79_00560 [Simkaniaceae bacterium]|nr:hypothetical protein [Simkaniaceae bacterium]